MKLILETPMPPVVTKPPKLLQRMLDHLRMRYDTIRTETAYLESGLAAAAPLVS
jgi:hypothetical protein